MYAKTKVFRIWHPTLIWGTLQTADYAAVITLRDPDGIQLELFWADPDVWAALFIAAAD